jgi:hypothetical protein
VIDTAERKVVATIALSGKPEFPVADGRGTVFANIESKNEIVRFDAAAKTITATWPVDNCDSPSGLAIDTKGRRLFAVCDGGKMAVVDANSGKTIANPAIGDGPDAARYDSARKLAFSSNGGGTLTIIDAGKSGYPVLQNLATQKGARLNSQGCLWAMLVGFVLGGFRLAVDTPVTMKLAGFEQGYTPGSFLWIVNNINFQYFSVLITIVSAVVMVGMSYATAAPDYGRIASLTFATASDGDRATTRASWDKREVLASFFILACILGAYIYFS